MDSLLYGSHIETQLDKLNQQIREKESYLHILCNLEKNRKHLQEKSKCYSKSTNNELSKRYSWETSYKDWDIWVKKDLLREELKKKRSIKHKLEKQIERRYIDESSSRLHLHDKSHERKLVSMSNKTRLCKILDLKNNGNVFFEEGHFLRAIQCYEKALTYYEYCDCKEEKQKKMADKVQTDCLLNASICFVKLNQYRKAIDYCTQVMSTHPNNIKARYRRAQAYRHLDHFTEAEIDLSAAFKQIHSRSKIKDYDGNHILKHFKREKHLLDEKINIYIETQKAFAKNMWTKPSQINSKIVSKQADMSFAYDEISENVNIETTDIPSLKEIFLQTLEREESDTTQTLIDNLTGIDLMDASIIKKINHESEKKKIYDNRNLDEKYIAEKSFNCTINNHCAYC